MANVLEILIQAKDQASKELAGVSKSFDKLSREMKIAGGIMAGAVAGVGVASIKFAMDFDKAMREVNTMMLLTEERFRSFSKEIQNLAKEMGVSAVGAANALYQAISAGIPEENAIDFLTVATKAAIGGVTDTRTAVDGLTTVINAFKLSVEDAQTVADLMFTTVKGGKTTFEELAASMFQVAPMAATAGVEFSEVSAALATMTKQGVPTRVATTQLRQAIQAMIKPTDEMKVAIQSLGYASGEALIESKGLKGALDDLTGAAGGSNEVLGRMFGSVEGLQAVLSLTGDNAETFANDLDAMANSAGAATDAFDQMEQTLSRQLEKMKVQFQDIAITIGTALMPALKSLMDFLSPMIEKIGEWIEEHPKLTLGIMGVVGAMGLMLLSAGPLLNTIKLMTVLIKSQTGALILHQVALVATTAKQWALNAAMYANPFIAVVAAIAGVIVASVKLYQNWEKLSEPLRNTFAALLGPAGGIVYFLKEWRKIKDEFGKTADWLKANWGKVGDFFKTIWTGIVDTFKMAANFIAGIINGLIGGFESFLNFFVGGLNFFINGINRIIGGVNKILPGALELAVIPTIGEVKLGRVPLMDSGGLIKGPGLFEVGPGVTEIAREPSTGEVHIHVGYLVGDELSLSKFAKLVKERIQRDDRRTAFGPVNQGYYYGRSST